MPAGRPPCTTLVAALTAGIPFASLMFPMAAAAQADPAAAGQYAETRAEFVAAYTDARLGRPSDGDSEALRDYPIYAYLEAARIVHAVDTASSEPGQADDSAESFIAIYATEPVSRGVRIAWLESLARRDRHDALIEYFDPAIAGTRLECEHLAARIATGDTADIEEPLRARWLTGSQLPPECEPVFEWGRANGVIDADAIEARVMLLLENGRSEFGRMVARRLPAQRAEPLNRWAALIASPDLAFDELIADPASMPSLDALANAWERYTRNSPGAALARFDALVEAIGADDETESLLRRALALGLAWDRRSEALGHFSAVEREHLDDYTLEWQARAALWAGQWPTAEDAIDAMSEGQRNQTAWRYWSARAADRLDREEEADAGYEAVLGDDNFYSALAAARLDRRYRPNLAPLEIESGSVNAVAEIPGFVRARELLFAGLETDARREWNAAYSTLSSDLQLACIELAASWDWHEIAVLTATRNGIFNDYELLYPRHYQEEIPDAADLTEFDRNLLYGLIRQESLFSPNAVSSAGAVGLMQLRLETAQRAAGRWELERPTRTALFDPRTNITLGAAQLRNLVDEFEGQTLPGLAGYNAGYNAAARWLPDTEIEADVWVENIPYNETRAYVRRVLWHSLVYRWLDTGRPQDASDWLSPIRRP